MNATPSNKTQNRTVDRLLYDPLAKKLAVTASDLGLFGGNEHSGEQKEIEDHGPELQLSIPLNLGTWLCRQSFAGDYGCFQVPVSAGAVFGQFETQGESSLGPVQITLDMFVADQHRVDLMQNAAFSHLVMCSGHEFLNHQNGIQMNARLIEIMNQNDNDTSVEIESALGRLLSDSNRSVSLFRALQEIERGRTAEDQAQVSISVMRELLDVLRGTQGRHVILELPEAQHLPSSYLLCLCVFLSGLVNHSGEALRVVTNGTELVITWCNSGSSDTNFWEEQLSPHNPSMVHSVLPMSFCAWGLMIEGQSAIKSGTATEHRLHLALPRP